MNLRLVNNIKLDQKFLSSIRLSNSQNRFGLLYSGTICKELGEKTIEKLAVDPQRYTNLLYMEIPKLIKITVIN